ncbi:hypothetical protein VNO78_28678 [Psophocarpus tetragonolobus]|uniref:Uncharacterized protein n=1 Tax=Psophocarpus tetragonolobus TaxID=3891 RepID=A0AAN9RTP8_PSOTE
MFWKGYRYGSQRSLIAEKGSDSHGMFRNQLIKTPLYMSSHFPNPAATTVTALNDRSRSDTKNNAPTIRFNFEPFFVASEGGSSTSKLSLLLSSPLPLINQNQENHKPEEVDGGGGIAAKAENLLEVEKGEREQRRRKVQRNFC